MAKLSGSGTVLRFSSRWQAPVFGRSGEHTRSGSVLRMMSGVSRKGFSARRSGRCQTGFAKANALPNGSNGTRRSDTYLKMKNPGLSVEVIGTGIMGADHVETIARAVSGAKICAVADSAGLPTRTLCDLLEAGLRWASRRITCPSPYWDSSFLR